MPVTNTSKPSSQIRLKRQDELLLNSFDGNSVAQAYDSTKYVEARSGSDLTRKHSHQFRRHQTSAKRSSQKSMVQARVNTSMDESLSLMIQKNKHAKSPTLHNFSDQENSFNPPNSLTNYNH